MCIASSGIDTRNRIEKNDETVRELCVLRYKKRKKERERVRGKYKNTHIPSYTNIAKHIILTLVYEYDHTLPHKGGE